jgi:hypothetical protein
MYDGILICVCVCTCRWSMCVCEVCVLPITVLMCNNVACFCSITELFHIVYSWTSQSIRLCVPEAIFKNECSHTGILYTLISVQLFASHVGQDSMVPIMAHYRLDGPGIEYQWWHNFSHPSLGPTAPPVSGYWVFPRDKVAGVWS